MILSWYEAGEKYLNADGSFDAIIQMPIREKIARMKYVPENKKEKEYEDIRVALNDAFEALSEGQETDE